MNPPGGTAARVRAALDQGAAGAVPANIALMHALMEAPSIAAFNSVLDGALLDNAAGAEVRARLDEILRLWRHHPQAWSLVHHVLASADHDAPKGASEQAVAHWAAAFDRVGRLSPDAGSALYALGDADLLARATGEIVEKLDAWGLFGPECRALEIGCGSGRFVEALAPRLHSIVGLDISGTMVAEARRRCAGLANVRIEHTEGRDLGLLADGALDLVLAIDVFPYLVDAGADLVADHMRESARVLRLGRALVVLNYSYRNDPDLDRADATRLAGQHGFVVERLAAGDFALWDGATFHFRKG